MLNKREGFERDQREKKREKYYNYIIISINKPF